MPLGVVWSPQRSTTGSPRMAARAPAATRCSAAVQTVRQHVASKTRSAREVTQQYLQSIAATEAQLGSFITVDEADALQQVQAALRGLAGGAGRGGRGQCWTVTGSENSA